MYFLFSIKKTKKKQPISKSDRVIDIDIFSFWVGHYVFYLLNNIN